MQVQLAKKLDDKFKGFKFPYYSRKFDGKRMYIIDGIGYSRTNKKCYQEPIKHIIEEIKSLSFYEKYVFDGELLYFENDGIENFTKGISLANSKNYTPECSKLIYVIFDMIPYGDFIRQETKQVFCKELDKMYHLLNPRNILTPDLCTLRPDLYMTDYRHLFLAAQHTSDKNFTDYRDFDKWEGLMVREGYAPYEFKRTGNLRKIKKFQDGEFEIIDYYFGTGKYEDILGGIVIDYKGNKVCVGSGFTDEQREEYLNGHEVDWLIGKKAKVKYFQESCDDKGKPSLRFPIFQCLRDNDMEEY